MFRGEMQCVGPQVAGVHLVACCTNEFEVKQLLTLVDVVEVNLLDPITQHLFIETILCVADERSHFLDELNSCVEEGYAHFRRSVNGSDCSSGFLEIVQILWQVKIRSNLNRTSCSSEH